MGQVLTINSINYSGESANILFKPDNDNVTINLGIQTLPYSFDPSLLTPQREIFGFYTVLLISGNCPTYLNIPRTTPTPTPTTSPTRTPTPTLTATPTPTPTRTTCVPTPTPSCGPTPAPQGFYYGRIDATSIVEADIDLMTFEQADQIIDSYITWSSATSAYGYILIPTTMLQPTAFRDSTSGCFGNNIPINNIGTINKLDANNYLVTYNIYRTFYRTIGDVNCWLCA